MTRCKTTLLLACAAAALLPGSATAATVHRDAGGALVYTADADRTNTVNVQSGDTGEISFWTSGGDAMSAIADGCAQSETYPGEVVTCTSGTAVRVELGDGDDRGVVSDAVSVPVALLGGDGSDDVQGKAGLRIRVTGAKPGPLTLTARHGRRVVARGTVRVGGSGRAIARLRFTAKARRSLRRKSRVKLTIAGGTAALNVTVRR